MAAEPAGAHTDGFDYCPRATKLKLVFLGRGALIIMRAKRMASSPGARVAVLGAGVSGLSAAYFLKRLAPKAAVTVFEASDRTGGWVKTTSVGRCPHIQRPRLKKYTKIKIKKMK